MSIKKAKHIWDVASFNTLRINFKYFKFKDAIKFPILCSRRVRLKHLSGSIIINGKIKTGIVKIGIDNSNIFDNKKSRSILYIQGVMVFNGKAIIGNGCKIQILPNAIIEFGEHVLITAESTLYCSNNISIGNNSLLSWNILIMDSDHHAIYNYQKQVINPSKPIVIGDDVWIGCNVTVLKGAVIPTGSIVGSNSTFTTQENTPNSIYCGIPAKLVKSNVNWEL